MHVRKKRQLKRLINVDWYRIIRMIEQQEDRPWLPLAVFLLFDRDAQDRKRFRRYGSFTLASGSVNMNLFYPKDRGRTRT
jgi:hypothetical protein